jgi:ATP-binding cassette subfamily B protein
MSEASPGGTAAAELLRFRPFDRLPPEQAAAVAAQLQTLHYRLGQTVLRPDQLPDGVLLVLDGSLRSLAIDPIDGELKTLELLVEGDSAGWSGLLRQGPCEHLRAATDTTLLRLPADAFGQLLARQAELRAWYAAHASAAELHQLLEALGRDVGQPLLNQQEWQDLRRQARVRSVAAGCPGPLDLTADRRWFVSSGGELGQPWPAGVTDQAPAAGEAWLRLLGLPHGRSDELSAGGAEPEGLRIGQRPSGPPQEPREPLAAPQPSAEPAPPASSQSGRLALRPASGPRAVPIELCVALADYFNLPINRDALGDRVAALLKQQAQLNLMNLGQLLDAIGLRVMLTELPRDRLARVTPPALLAHEGQFAILDGVDPDGRLRLLEPELGPLRIQPERLGDARTGMVPILLLQRQQGAKQRRFNWAWYGPFLSEHRRPLVEVLALSVVINLLTLVTPLGLQQLIDQVVHQDNLNALISISTVLIMAAAIRGVMKSLRSYIFTDTTNRIDQATKSTILDQLVRLPQVFFDTRPVGQVIHYFHQLDRLREFLVSQSIPTAVDFLFSFLYLAILLSLSIPLTIASLATLPLMLILAIISNPLMRAQINRSMGEAVKTYAYLNESITGIQTIKSQNAELATRWEFQNRYSRFIGEDFKLKVTRESLANLAGFIHDLNSLVVVGVGIFLVMRNQLSLGSFIAFRIVSGYITGPLVKMVQTWQQFEQSSASLRMVADVVDRPTEQSPEEALNIPMPPLQGRVHFVDVVFRYAEEQEPILNGVNLDVPTGSFVGLVGGSGSGKSTLLKLLPRFYRPNAGRVLVDGLDINKVELYSLRRQIGVVPQDTVLFDGTVRDNLLLVKPDATAAELMAAARLACAHDFIMTMPKGYNSDVGERGAGLSGGQRQRLALARAILQNPRLLILDEATSALDARTERQVCLNLLEAFRGRTVFFITHRLTTVQPADLIVLMDRGAVMEAGTHPELMARRGWYYALYRSQQQEQGA